MCTLSSHQNRGKRLALSTRSRLPGLVTAIIPTYNRAAVLSRAIDSVLEQSYPLVELVVVDDGSTDVTKSLVRTYGNALRYVRQSHAGVSIARNAGIRSARGEWLAFLDADDLWHRDKLNSQLEALQRSGGYLFSHTDEICIRNGVRVNPGNKHAKHTGFIYPQCLPRCIISPSSALMHHSIISRVGQFDPDLPVCEDYDMWLRITWRYPVLLQSDKLITKTGGHPDQLSRRFWGMDRFRLYALEKMLQEPLLPETLRYATSKEFCRKAQILARGYEKRGNRAQLQALKQRVQQARRSVYPHSS